MTANNKTITINSSPSILFITFLLFLTLDLTGVVDWPWYVIGAPIFLAWGIGLSFIAFFIFISITEIITRR